MDKMQPVFILPQNTTRSAGKGVQQDNIRAAKAIADAVRTTLGPKGMDKMIVDANGDIIVTNDGVTILEQMNIEHPAGKLLVEVASTQEQEIGDGTTTAVILAGELLHKAADLLEKNIHPTIIAKGYQIAAEEAITFLKSIAKDITKKDTDVLEKIAQTAMTGKGSESAKKHLASLVVKAVAHAKSREDIKIQTVLGGSTQETKLIEGVVIDKEILHHLMPTELNNASVALFDCPLEVKGTQTDAKIQINDPSQITSFLEQEEQLLEQMVKHISAADVKVVFCQKGIDDIAQHFLAKKGILALRRVKKLDMEIIAKMTGAKIITRVKDFTKQDSGHAGNIKQEVLAGEKYVFVTKGKNPQIMTLLVKGGTSHVTQEVKRALEDAIGDVFASIQTGKVLGGAGSTEIEVMRHIKSIATNHSGREQMAIEAFANAFSTVPSTLAENAGLDPIDTMTRLVSQHEKGKLWAGIDVFTGNHFDAFEQGVIEPLSIKTQAISSASEVANLLLRIDDVITAEKETYNE